MIYHIIFSFLSSNQKLTIDYIKTIVLGWKLELTTIKHYNMNVIDDKQSLKYTH